MPTSNNNPRPRFVGAPNTTMLQGMTAALSAADLTTGTLGTNVYVAFTASATVDSYLRRLTIKAQPINNTAATIARVWMNNGSTIATAANSSLFGELAIPATTASTTVATPDFVIPVNKIIPVNWRVLLTFSVAPGGSGAFSCFGEGFDY